MIKSFGRLISYGERTARSYNFPDHIVYKIWTNTGSLDVIFDKKTENIYPLKKNLLIDYKDGMATLQESPASYTSQSSGK